MIAADLMVLNVTQRGIVQRRAVVSDWAWYPVAKMYSDLNPAKYASATDQLDMMNAIPASENTYRKDGY